MLIFKVFGLTRPRFEPKFPVLVSDALSTRPLIDFFKNPPALVCLPFQNPRVVFSSLIPSWQKYKLQTFFPVAVLFMTLLSTVLLACFYLSQATPQE